MYMITTEPIINLKSLKKTSKQVAFLNLFINTWVKIFYELLILLSYNRENSFKMGKDIKFIQTS